MTPFWAEISSAMRKFLMSSPAITNIVQGLNRLIAKIVSQGDKKISPKIWG